MCKRTHALIQAIASLLCAAVTWKVGLDLEAEFSGGRVTGRLLHIQHIAGLLFLAAALASFFSRRIGGAAVILACALCAPLNAYLIFPGLFQSMFPGNYRVRGADFVWNSWA